MISKRIFQYRVMGSNGPIILNFTSARKVLDVLMKSTGKHEREISDKVQVRTKAGFQLIAEVNRLEGGLKHTSPALQMQVNNSVNVYREEKRKWKKQIKPN